MPELDLSTNWIVTNEIENRYAYQILGRFESLTYNTIQICDFATRQSVNMIDDSHRRGGWE